MGTRGSRPEGVTSQHGGLYVEKPLGPVSAGRREGHCPTSRGPSIKGGQKTGRKLWSKICRRKGTLTVPECRRPRGQARPGTWAARAQAAQPPPQACSPAPRPAPCLPRNFVARNETSRPHEEGTRVRLMPFLSFRYKLLKSISLAHKRRKIRIVGRLRLSLSNDVKVQR